MKITYLSNVSEKGTLDKRLIDKLVDNCNQFVDVVRAVNEAFRNFGSASIKTLSSTMVTSASSTNVELLKHLIVNLNKINDDANKVHASFVATGNAIIDVAAGRRTRSVPVIENIITVVRHASKSIPTWVPLAKDLNGIDSDEGQMVLKSLRVTGELCWESLKRLNEILDSAGFVREGALRHLPENESELSQFT